MFRIQKLFGLSLGTILVVLMMIIPITQTQAATKATFDFPNRTLVRGQENTINFSVTNTSGYGEWFSAIGFGTLHGYGIENRWPADGSTVAGVNAGPWDVDYVVDVDNAGKYTGYDGILWSVLTTDLGFITGRKVFMPGFTEDFFTTIYVPTSLPLGNHNAVVLAAKYGNSGLQIADELVSFTIVDPTPTSVTTATVTSLPQSGVDL